MKMKNCKEKMATKQQLGKKIATKQKTAKKEEITLKLSTVGQKMEVFPHDEMKSGSFLCDEMKNESFFFLEEEKGSPWRFKGIKISSVLLLFFILCYS